MDSPDLLSSFRSTSLPINFSISIVASSFLSDFNLLRALIASDVSSSEVILVYVVWVHLWA
jgi:hypothetical protein